MALWKSPALELKGLRTSEDNGPVEESRAVWGEELELKGLRT
jgi:hypothetical protein